MSLISQNPKDSTKKGRRNDDIALVESDEKFNSDMKSNRKKKRGRSEDDEEMKEMMELENSLFGSVYNPVEFRDYDDVGKEEEARGDIDEDSALFFTDRSGDNNLPMSEDDLESNDETEEKQKKPAWVDEEDEKALVNIAKVPRLRKLRKSEEETVISGSEYVARLRAHHKKMNSRTDWARVDFKLRDNSSDDEDSDKESSYEDQEIGNHVLRTNEDLVAKSGAKLQSGVLEYSRLVDVNINDRSHGPVNSVQFHNNSQLLLVGGLDKTLRFFQIDGKKNVQIQSIFLSDCPIRKASFLPDGSQVIISGRRKFAYCCDLVNTRLDKIGPLIGRDEKSLESFEVSPDSNMIAFLGNEGSILLVSSKTKELIGTLKMNGTVRSVSFTNDAQKLLSTGGDGKIYHWDLRTRTCFHIGVDEGCTIGTSVCTSPVGNLFAAGSESGVVNIYNRDEFLGGKKKPLKVIENLTTKVNFMKFNHDGQILAISSCMKKNSSKLIHIPSLSVFTNWPPRHSMEYPRCLDFSPRGGFMALGNAAGKVLLYKLHHYHQA